MTKRAKAGQTYWAIGSVGTSGYWVTILGSHYGTRVDPPADALAFIGATLFTTEQAAKEYRAKLAPHQLGASGEFDILRVVHHGNEQFGLADYREDH